MIDEIPEEYLMKDTPYATRNQNVDTAYFLPQIIIKHP